MLMISFSKVYENLEKHKSDKSWGLITLDLNPPKITIMIAWHGTSQKKQQK